MSSETYSSPAVQTPSLARLRLAAERCGLDIEDDQLLEYQGIFASHLDSFTLTDALPEDIPIVKYPRTPGYRPSKEENTHNAWYWKTDIRGAGIGPLFGKTVAIKDNVAVAGVPMMNGSRMLEGYIPEFDATVVTRILDAGGAIKGKATCEDLCVSGTSFTTAKGAVHNPVDRSHASGGSSSGSAVLVSLGEVDMAIGGDQGGSIRIPASWCGIVGLKPTHGLVPYTGALGIDPTIDHLGPMTRTVADAALLLEVIAGYDPMDSRQSRLIPKCQVTKELTGCVSGIKIGLLEEGFANCDNEVCDMVKKACQYFIDLGVSVDKVSVPLHSDAGKICFPLISGGIYSNIVKGEVQGGGKKEFYATSMCEAMRVGAETKLNDTSPRIKMYALMGEYINSEYGNKFYNKSQNLRGKVQQAYDKILSEYDALVMPTVPCTAPKLPGTDIKDSAKAYIDASVGMFGNTYQFNYTGHPALSLPCGEINNLPVGMMIVGKHFEDGKVLNIAYALEQKLSKSKP